MRVRLANNLTPLSGTFDRKIQLNITIWSNGLSYCTISVIIKNTIRAVFALNVLFVSIYLGNNVSWIASDFSNIISKANIHLRGCVFHLCLSAGLFVGQFVSSTTQK